MNAISFKKSFYIPAGMTVTGSFSSNAPGQIAGVVNGDVLVNAKLNILKNGVINGNVNAHDVEIWGSVTGDIECGGKATLQNTAFVKGNINTVQIHLEKNAQVDGIIAKPDNQSTSELPLLTETGEKTPVPSKVTGVRKVDGEIVQSWF